MMRRASRRIGRGRYYDDDDDDDDDNLQESEFDAPSLASGGTGAEPMEHLFDDHEDQDYPTMAEFYGQVMNSGNENGGGGEVVCFKTVVFMVLAVAALVIGNAAFVFTTGEINSDYLNEFNAFATNIVEVAQNRIDVAFHFTTAFRDHIVSHCIEGAVSSNTNNNCSWPFVSLEAFEERHYAFANENLEQTERVALIPLVSLEQRELWEDYSVANQGWVQEGADYRLDEDSDKVSDILPYIHIGNEESSPMTDPHAVFWQIAPAPVEPRMVNFNALVNPQFRTAYEWIRENREHPILSEIIKFEASSSTFTGVQSTGSSTTEEEEDPMLLLEDETLSQQLLEEPTSWILAGIGEDFSPKSTLVGLYGTLFTWSSFFLTSIPPGRGDLVLILEDFCEASGGGGDEDEEIIENDTYSYSIAGETVTFLGPGDWHDINYENHVVTQELATTTSGDAETPCKYVVRLYPTEEFRRSFESTTPLVYTSVVLVVMLSTIFLFCLYDYLVEKRQRHLEVTAAKSNALVNSLFPDQVREQLLKDADTKKSTATGKSQAATLETEASDIDPLRPLFLRTKPIAELFPETTVMFADIVGFTAWSSAREPAQVFTLLETIYHNFDMSANKRGIFKVETIGDSYVAGAGLPAPRKDHAIAMARFAYSLIRIMKKTAKELEVTLGPDTEDLTVRIGMHSGPVTGGVLRGEKSRFQLFGDTVNTAARMESNGQSGKVHMSQDTADLLRKAGRGHWVKARESLVNTKGKGRLQTYWLDFKGQSSTNENSSTGNDDASQVSDAEDDEYDEEREVSEVFNESLLKLDKKSRRVVDWLVQMLMKYLKQIVAMRDTDNVERTERRVSVTSIPPGGTVLDEVEEIIALPTIAANYKRDPETVKINPQVEAQLLHYVSRIAAMYHDNHFHNFEHASHVTMSVAKLLSRIISPHDIDYSEMTYKQKKGHAKLHQQTYGITSDPLTQFAIVFSGLIHDVDHSGVPNAQMVKEGNELARLYKGKSVAEQNSVDLAWGMLASPKYELLLRCICAKREERVRFRQLVVNSVMATDIVDKDLGALRKQRWEKAFSADGVEENPRDRINRKATIVIEHLIQASDVAHTMQHWHVYQKWNEKFFRECYKAYKDGRADKDPSEGWYQGELGFFDFYIIPLAKKLRECGVFGVSSDEYLNYAMANREEWSNKGRAIVEKYLANAQAQGDSIGGAAD